MSGNLQSGYAPENGPDLYHEAHDGGGADTVPPLLLLHGGFTAQVMLVYANADSIRPEHGRVLQVAGRPCLWSS